MKDASKIFEQLVQQRRSMRQFDSTAEFDPESVTRSLERATLAPNSSNLQLWEFYRVRTPEKRAQLAKICMNQNAARTARELVVFVVRKDKWKDHSQWIWNSYKSSFGEPPYDKGQQKTYNYYNKLIPIIYKNDIFGIFGALKKMLLFFASLRKPMYQQGTSKDTSIIGHKSVALAAQTFMLSMTAEGYDTCPMEGFDFRRLKKFLNLPRRAEVCMVVATGPGTKEGIYHERMRLPNDQVIFEI